MKRLLLAGLVVLLGASIAVAFAASLGVTSDKLTLFSKNVTRTTVTCAAATGIDDAYVQQDDAANPHNGTLLDVRFAPAGARMSLIKFDLPGCGIPGDALIDTATLELFLAIAPATNQTYNVFRVTGAWTESVTWNTRPAVAATATATFPAGTTNGVWKTADVTGDVTAFFDGTTNNGWRVHDPAAPTALGQFASSENGTTANRPKLVVTYVA